MKKQILSALATATLVAAFAPVAMAQNVAIVNGKPIPTSRVDAMVEQLQRSGRQVTPEMQGQIKEQVILREIFMQEAQVRGLDATVDFKTQMELARQAILIRALFDDYASKNPISDDQLKAEYDKFAAANSGNDYKAHHILVESEDEAKAIIAKLKKGGKFEEIAKKSSKDTGSGAKGGALDWAPPSAYVKEFGDALASLGKGKTTETPVKTQFGYHVIRVDDVRPTVLPKFEDVKADVAKQMQQKKMSDYQTELRAKAKVE